MLSRPYTTGPHLAGPTSHRAPERAYEAQHRKPGGETDDSLIAQLLGFLDRFEDPNELPVELDGPAFRPYAALEPGPAAQVDEDAPFYGGSALRDGADDRDTVELPAATFTALIVVDGAAGREITPTTLPACIAAAA
jgi:hypothetical protein